MICVLIADGRRLGVNIGIAALKGRLFLLFLTIEFLGCFMLQEVNFVFSKYTSLLTFVLLTVLIVLEKHSLFKEPSRLFKEERELMAVFAGCIIALLNLFIVGSNKGAFLTAADVLLAFYAMKDMRLTKKQTFYGFSLGAAMLIWWYPVVRWEYNFNMTGMIFIVSAILSMLFLERLKKTEKMKNEKPELLIVQIVLLLTSTLLCLLYHARCAMIGMIIFAVLTAVIKAVSKRKLLRGILIFMATAFSIAFTGLYIFLDKAGISITILYKNIISGRQKIWEELWGQLLSKPLTGIGSSYVLKSHKIFEVHNGFFDILVVHGIIVFAIVLWIVIRRLWEVMKIETLDAEKRIALAGLFAILFSSFFENFFINSPYLLVVMLLVSVCKSDA